MKLEIEIQESEIKAAIERKIRAAVANETSSYTAEKHIKEQVKKLWPEVVTQVITEELKNLPALRLQIRSEIEAKVKRQLTALMGEKK